MNDDMYHGIGSKGVNDSTNSGWEDEAYKQNLLSIQQKLMLLWQANYI